MSIVLTVLSWLWAQPSFSTQYTAAHVNIWADMVRRHLSLPHRIACVTDTPKGIDPRIAIIPPPRDFEEVRIPTWGKDKPQCLRRLALFRPDAAEIFGERFVSMDLDCVIAGCLDPLFDVSDDFKIYEGSPHPKRPYAGAMVLMTAGARPQVYKRFTPERAAEAGRRFLGSDQAWINAMLGPGEATWGREDGVYWWPLRLDERCRIMFPHGRPKPWDVVANDSSRWVVEHYRADPRGLCLMLGYGESVWDDAAAAIARHGRGLPIIASPEAARHCDSVLAVAEDDAQADRLAWMYGYEPIWCGRSKPWPEVAAA